MTTFAEIQSARLALTARLDRHPDQAFAAELPEWQQVQPRHVDDRTDTSCGILYQPCGGGRRVIRKKIGGN